MNINDYKILEGESDEDFRFRIYALKEKDGLCWEDIAAIINRETGESYSESKYRKEWKNYNRGYNDRDAEDSVSPKVDDTMAKYVALEKEKMKLADLRVQTRADIRRMAREETCREIAVETAKLMNDKKALKVSPIRFGSIKTAEGNAAIAPIHDWHYGIEIDSPWNTYNPDVCRARVNELLNAIVHRCEQNNVRQLYVVNLGDMIAGAIHLQIRLESRCDIITQIMEVSEIIAEFLHELACRFEVHYMDCLDNHSRIDPNKKTAMALESLARITTWYLKERLGDSIAFHDNFWGPDICNFTCKGFNVIGVHGDKDRPSNIIDKLSTFTKEHYDLVLSAHLHHFNADESNETMLISGGSLMGTDEFATSLRLSSRPSQNLIIVTDDNVCDSLYRIVLH